MRTIFSITTCLLLSACTPSIDEGIAAYKAKHYDQALKILNKHADDPITQFYLYKIYSNNKLSYQDEKRAINYLKHSAEHGNTEAQEELANKYYWGFDLARDHTEALRLYTAAASQGRASANVGIGKFYELFEPKKALQYYLLAGGTALGDMTLAHAYEIGNVVSQNPNISFDYLLAANRDQEIESELTYPSARYDLAEYYYYGFGTHKNDEEALKLLASIKDNIDDAAAFYAWMLFWGEGIKAAPDDAVKIWLSLRKKALDNAEKYGVASFSSYAFYGLVIAFTDGRGTTANPSQVTMLMNDNKLTILSPELDKWLRYKYNAAGYLHKECKDDEVFGEVTIGSVSGRYKPLKSDALLAISQCLPKSTSEERLKAYFLAKKADELGNRDALLVALQQWSIMSEEDRAWYFSSEKHIALKRKLFNAIE